MQLFDAQQSISSLDSDKFVELLAQKLAGVQPAYKVPQSQSLVPAIGAHTGGARPRKEPITKHKENVAKRTSTTTKSKKVMGTRHMVGFSEFDGDMFGGMSDNEMRNIARASTNQKSTLHTEAVAKILKHLGKDGDMLTAKAVKAILYDEIKQKLTTSSGLDKAAALLKMAEEKKNIDKALKQETKLAMIISYLKKKEEDLKNPSNDTKSKKKPKTEDGLKKHKSKKTPKTEDGLKKHKSKKNNASEFESSVELTSANDSDTSTD